MTLIPDANSSHQAAVASIAEKRAKARSEQQLAIKQRRMAAAALEQQAKFRDGLEAEWLQQEKTLIQETIARKLSVVLRRVIFPQRLLDRGFEVSERGYISARYSLYESRRDGTYYFGLEDRLADVLEPIDPRNDLVVTWNGLNPKSNAELVSPAGLQWLASAGLRIFELIAEQISQATREGQFLTYLRIRHGLLAAMDGLLYGLPYPSYVIRLLRLSGYQCEIDARGEQIQVKW